MAAILYQNAPHISLKWGGTREGDRANHTVRCLMARGKETVWELCQVTGRPLTLFDKCHGIFNDQSESVPRFNVSYKGHYLLQHSVPVTAWGHWDLLRTEGMMPLTVPATQLSFKFLEKLNLLHFLLLLITLSDNNDTAPM